MIMPTPQGPRVNASDIIIFIVFTVSVVHGSKNCPEIIEIIAGIAPIPTTVETDVIKIDKFMSPRKSNAKSFIHKR